MHVLGLIQKWPCVVLVQKAQKILFPEYCVIGIEEDGAVASIIFLSRERVASTEYKPLLARQGFYLTIQDCALSLSIYTGCTPCWSSCRGLNVLRLRQRYIVGR